MGSRMIRDRSRDSRWWLIVGLFTVCVVGWSLAFSFKVSATDSAATPGQIASSADKIWNLSEFTRISIAGSHGVTLVQGDKERISASGTDDALERLEVFVRDDELVIRNKRRGVIGSLLRGWDDGRANLLIEFIDLEQLKLSGSGLLRVAELRSPEFALVVSGSGSTDIEHLVGDSLNLRVSGSGDINLAGGVDRQVISISGSGHYEGRNLATEAATIRVSGSGNANVAASILLDASISGSGSVRYRGEPKVNSSISGSGRVRPL